MSATEPERSPSRESRPRVIVLGGGFAGIGAARKLGKADVDVVLVDGHDYHRFQPLLYQVATGLLPQVTVGHPLRDLFREQPSARVHTTGVTSVDLDKHEVRLVEMGPMPYEYLVLALGAEVNFFGVRGATEHAFPLYTLADAVRPKDHILERSPPRPWCWQPGSYCSSAGVTPGHDIMRASFRLQPGDGDSRSPERRRARTAG